MMDEPDEDDEITEEQWEAFVRNATFEDLVEVASAETIGMVNDLVSLIKETMGDSAEKERRLKVWLAMNLSEHGSDRWQ